MEAQKQSSPRDTQFLREAREQSVESSQSYHASKERRQAKRVRITKKKKTSSTLHLVVVRTKLSDGSYQFRTEKKVSSVASNDPEIIRRIVNKQRKDFVKSMIPKKHLQPYQGQVPTGRPSSQNTMQPIQPEPKRQPTFDPQECLRQLQQSMQLTMQMTQLHQIQMLQQSSPEQCYRGRLAADQLLTTEQGMYAKQVAQRMMAQGLAQPHPLVQQLRFM